MIFIDAHERTIDAKNRIQIPAEYRRFMGPDEGGNAFFLCMGEQENTLCLYPERTFLEQAKQRQTEWIPGTDPRLFEIFYYSDASRLEMDKQGRVVLPDRQLAQVNLGNEITLAGAKTHIIIWKSSEYAEFMRTIRAEWGKLQRFVRQKQVQQAVDEPR